jgi:hypothetical protein
MHKTDEEIVKLVLDECKKIDDVLNNVFLKKFAQLHNIDLSENYLQLKQEVVAKNSIFLDVKKKYCLHIINREGKMCDTFDIKGMVTQRSEYPEITKEKILELLDMLIKNDSLDFNRIHAFFEDTKNQILEMCENRDKKTARVSSMRQDVNSYIKKPYQVIAMELWNNLEYEYFVPGTKGYLYNISGIDHTLAPENVLKKSRYMTSKHKYIAIPYELERLPDYYIIDLERQLRYSWIDRQSEILRVLKGELYETKRQIIEEFDYSED